MSEFLVVTGMSGAGRSTAAATLEDLGWFVIDNVPAALIMKMVEMIDLPGSEIERVALVIGRGGANTGVEYFDDDEELVVCRAREVFPVPERMLQARQAIERDHAEEGHEG